MTNMSERVRQSGFGRLLGGLLLLAGLGAALPAGAAIPASERQVLLNLYSSTDGDNWSSNDGWNGAAGTECTWEGIQCDTNELHVISIDRYSKHLVGTLPAISDLSFLREFDVVANQLSGPLPSLTGLTDLQRFLASINQFTGPIPPLTNLTQLDTFDVGSNALTGSIPPLASLASLTVFNVQSNQLSGPIPALTGLTHLHAFYGRHNQLTGPIPSLADLSNLSSFVVEDNHLTGIGSLAGLTNLGEFFANDNDIAGSLPSFADLTSITTFDVHNNQLTGVVPSLASLSNLHHLYIDHNQLSGNIPDVPSTNSLYKSGSMLCPNALNRIPNADWDSANLVTPWYEFCTGSEPSLAVTGVSPSSATQGTAVDVTIFGVDFDATMSFSLDGSGVAIDNVVVVDTATATATFAVATSAAAGTRTLTATRVSDGAVATLANAFTVVASTVDLDLLSVAPSSGVQGASVPITINGSGFDQTTSFAFGSGITASSLSIVSASNATATLTIAASAATGARAVTATRSSDGGSAQLADGFTVVANTPDLGLVSVSPASGSQGASVPIAINGTGFDQTTSFAFGNGITVDDLSIASATGASAILSISSSAATGARTVTATRGSDDSSAQLAGGFMVVTDTPDLGLSAVSPSSGTQGTSVPIVISGTGFDQTTSFAFGSGITVNGLSIASATSASASLLIDASAATGARTISVGRSSDDSSAQLVGGFTVVADTPDLGLSAVSPSSGTQGTSVPIAISGTGFDQTTTFAFGDGITVNELSVASATSASATLVIDASAAAGARTVSVGRGSDDSSAQLAGGFTVLADTPPPPTGNVVLHAMTSGSGPFGVGDTLSYTLSVDNSSGAEVGDIEVIAQGPASQISVTDVQCNATITDGGIEWPIGALADGDGATCTFGARVDALAAGCTSRCQITVTVTASYSGGQTRTNAVIGTLVPPQVESTTVTGEPTTRDSIAPALSANGGMIVFGSYEKDLVAENANGEGADIYLRDRQAGETRLISRTAGGQLGGNNRDVALALNGRAAAFVHEPGNGEAMTPGAKDGGDAQLCTSQPNSLFQMECETTGADGAPLDGDVESPSMSADGKLIAFCSSASNWVAGDTNGKKDVFLKDQRSDPATVTRISTTATGEQGDGDSCEPMISGNGLYVAFTTQAANLGGSGAATQIVRKDLGTGAMQPITGIEGAPADADAGPPSISADGQRITFASHATNLVEGVANGKRNVFVYESAEARRGPKDGSSNNLFVMRGADGQLPNGDSEDPEMACGGKAIGVTSTASNLVAGDSNATSDYFVYGLGTDTIVRPAPLATGEQPNGPSQHAALDCEAGTGAYDTNATGEDNPNPNADVVGQDDPLRGDANAIVLDGSYSGNWYNPGQSGHGYLLEALPNGSFYATWYIFKDGAPLFLQGQGVPVGNRLDVDMYSVTSTAFPVGPGRPTVADWGRVTFTFTSSNDGTASWQPVAAGFTAGSMTLRRLSTAARVESDFDGALGACNSGIWYDPSHSGYGFDLEFNDQADGSRIVQAFWYTYRPDGLPLWLVGIGVANPAGVDLDLIQLDGPGAQFPPAFSADGVDRTPWGNATLTFGPGGLAVQYSSVLPGYGSGTLVNLQRLTVLDQRACTN
jgi:hypothetical protein